LKICRNFFWRRFSFFIQCCEIFSLNLFDTLLWSFSSTTSRRDYCGCIFLILVWLWFRCEIFSWNCLFNYVSNASLYKSCKKFHLFYIVQRQRFNEKTQVIAQFFNVDAFLCYFLFDEQKLHFQRENDRDWYVIWKLIEIRSRFAFNQIVF
jgi:hypothetical protein